MLSAPFHAKNIVLHIGFFSPLEFLSLAKKITLFLSVSSCFSVSVCVGGGEGAVLDMLHLKV